MRMTITTGAFHWEWVESAFRSVDRVQKPDTKFDPVGARAESYWPQGSGYGCTRPLLQAFSLRLLTVFGETFLF